MLAGSVKISGNEDCSHCGAANSHGEFYQCLLDRVEKLNITRLLV